MIGPKPKFFDSPYFVSEMDNWHLKPGAPQEIVKEFNEYMSLDSDNIPVIEPVKKSFTDTIQDLLKDFPKVH